MPKVKELVETHSIDVPVSVSLSRNTNWLLNLNNYRNAHFQVLNKAKVNFKNSVQSQLKALPEFLKLESIEYTLWRDNKRNCDVANVCSVVDKFFCDALVEAGKLPDDNWHYLKKITYSWGGILTDSSKKSYVEITLTGKTKMNLNITLDRQDILTAIKNYVSETYPTFVGNMSDVKLIVERGNNVSAIININDSAKGKSLDSSGNDSNVSDSRSVSGKQSRKVLGDAEKTVDNSTGTEPAEYWPTAKADSTSDIEKTNGDTELHNEPEDDTQPKSLFGHNSMGTSSEPEISDPDTSDNVVSNSEPVEQETNIGMSIFGRKKKAN